MSKRNSAIPMTIAACLLSAPAFAKYGGGSGTEEEPYQIASVAHFLELSATQDDWNKDFVLLADIDLAGQHFTQAPIAPDISTDMSFQGREFTGRFDGNGHVIRNLTVAATSQNHVGLFGRIYGGVVMNLGVENANITGEYAVGGLAGEGGTITSCYVTASVDGAYRVGGLVGSGGKITSCYATGSVSGSREAGGLAGNGGIIAYCYATSSVSGQLHVNGLANSARSTASFWDIQTSGQIGSGGGKGLTTEQMKSLSIFQNAGWADKGWVIQDGVDYPRLNWEDTDGIPIPVPEPIPLAGSGTEEEPYLVSTPQEFRLLSWHVSLLDKHLQLTADLDVSGLTLYPFGNLGSFTGVFEGNGHTISNAVIHQPNSGFVGLFSRVGSRGEIRNLGVEHISVEGRDVVGGLVGYTRGTITSCCVTGSVSGYEYVGGLVGSNPHRRGTIMSCYASASVTGRQRCAGGLVGANAGTITSCYATGSVSGRSLWYVGGLVGKNHHGKLTSCYATGPVSGYKYVGGLVGQNWGSVSKCYSIGFICGNDYVGGLVGKGSANNVISSFWDIQTSDHTISAGGQAKRPPR